MKNTIYRIVFLGLFSAALLSCEDDPLEDARQITVQFESQEKELAENAESSITLSFNKPAPADAVISLKAGNGFEGVLDTEPVIENGFINIAVAKGDLSALIKLKPVDNAQTNPTRTLDITLHQLPASFKAGVNKSLSLRVNDDETNKPQSVANFILKDAALQETNQDGIEYQIHFSEEVAINSEIRIELSSEKGTYGSDFTTEPAAVNGIIYLPVNAGLRVSGFRVKPVHNNQITGELEVNFTIVHGQGSILLGTTLDQKLVIRDKELELKPKGYEVTAGNTILKHFIEYNSQGRVAKVNWETYTPYLTQGTDTYFYDAAGNIVRINKHAHKDVVYQWSDGRIVKSEEVSDGVVTAYTEYDYDDAGNVGGVVSYHLHNGEFVKGMYTIYLYYLDGNLFKSLTYQDNPENPEEPYLTRERTYENYNDVANPFPMTEILPGVNPQKTLATKYYVKESGIELTYNMVYEYRPDGLPGKRIATATGDQQTAVYHYY